MSNPDIGGVVIVTSRLLKNSFFSSLWCGTGMCRRFSNTRLFEKRSKTPW
jgi:hypothetical protein